MTYNTINASMTLVKTLFSFSKAFPSVLSCKNALLVPKMSFYAVAKGRTPGIYMTWSDCEAQVKGFSGARYKKFSTVDAAQQFVTSITSHNHLPPKQTSSISSSSNNNLKRTYTKSSNNRNKNLPVKNNYSEKEPESDNESETFSDGSDDLNAILTKQLDDVEKRLKGFGKNVDKIIKKSTKNSSRKTILIDPPPSKKRRSSGGTDFQVDSNGYTQVYTDGACSANGRSGARAGLGVYWGDGHPLNISEPVSGRATNNCGEIQAATRAIKIALENGVQKLSINTDSQFLINSVTKWIPGNLSISCKYIYCLWIN